MAKKEKSTKVLDKRILMIAEKLKQVRIEQGYTSYENFTIDKGLPRVQYWRMEKGTNFQFESLLKILDAQQVSLADFFSTFTDIPELEIKDF